ncbi:MAG: hypothetical protein Q7S82_04085 [bacterium]|nr:hypothetical protein [bacterium]
MTTLLGIEDGVKGTVYVLAMSSNKISSFERKNQKLATLEEVLTGLVGEDLSMFHTKIVYMFKPFNSPPVNFYKICQSTPLGDTGFYGVFIPAKTHIFNVAEKLIKSERTPGLVFSDSPLF